MEAKAVEQRLGIPTALCWISAERLHQLYRGL